MQSGPVAIKTLIEKFKAKFRTCPESKETLRALIKKMCAIKTDPETGEKLLVLKDKDNKKEENKE